MLGLVIRRVLWAPVLLLVAMFVTFLLMRGIGGSPFRLESGGLPYSLQVQLTRFYRLEEPWYVEILVYVRHVVTLDFGPSLVQRDVTVDAVLSGTMPVTIELALRAVAWAVPIGVALGLFAAARRGTRTDALAAATATLLLVVPVFLLAEVASTYLVEQWQLFPDGWGAPRSKILPSLVLGLAPAGYVARVVRAGAVETIGSDYVRTARAKGLRWPRVLALHVLPNSLAPFFAAAVPTMALLVTGAFFVESSFAIPGAADYFVAAAKTRDYPMVMGMTVVLAAIVIVANLVADVLGAALDPRRRDAAR